MRAFMLKSLIAYLQPQTAREGFLTVDYQESRSCRERCTLKVVKGVIRD